jgi:hypothetical protein
MNLLCSPPLVLAAPVVAFDSRTKSLLIVNPLDKPILP